MRSSSMDARSRTALVRLLWDFLGTEFGSRHCARLHLNLPKREARHAFVIARSWTKPIPRRAFPMEVLPSVEKASDGEVSPLDAMGSSPQIAGRIARRWDERYAFGDNAQAHRRPFVAVRRIVPRAILFAL